MTRRSVLILPIILLAGCPAVDTRELNFTRHKPRVEDLIGTWSLDKESMEDIRERGKYLKANPLITLRIDGTFSIRDMPDWWSSEFGKSSGNVESFDGLWNIEQTKEIWNVWSIDLQAPQYRNSIHLYRQKPPYALFIVIGDPNDANAMIFERNTPNKKHLP